MKLFLDTNILIDFVTERTDDLHNINYYQDAATLMSFASLRKIQVVLSSLTVVNAMYVCVERIKLPLKDVREKLDFIRPFIMISSIDDSDVYSSYDSDWKDFEDGVQYFSAKRFGCDYIVTRNIKDFEKSDIPVVTPIQMTNILYELNKAKK